MPDSSRTRDEADQVGEHAAPRTPVIYEVVRRHGDEEMSRPVVSLWWSAVAAGLSISFSLLAEGILERYLPAAEWRQLVVSFGYPVGFLIVVLGRQQLFTENTITAVLPLMAEPSARNLARLARMWSLVLAGNLAGTLVAALLCAFTPVVTPELRAAMLDVARPALQHGALGTGFGAITAGFLMATMVWLLPAAEGARFYVIALLTWLIGVGGFAHVVAGSVETFLLFASGEIGGGVLVGGFLLPTLVGNIVGGTALFALLAYAQVMKEL